MVLESKLIKLDGDNNSDFEEAVDAMIDSFSIMPTWKRLYLGNDTSRVRAKVVFFLRASFELGEVWGIRRNGDEHVLDSVIALLPPGKTLFDAPSATANWNTFINTLGEEGCAIISESVVYHRPGYDQELAGAWYISLIGTRPSAAGRGLGTQLIQFAIDKAEQEGCGIWVPTTYAPRMRFYEKLDFIHVQTKSVATPFGGVADEYAMFRPL